MDMPVKLVAADPRVKADEGSRAIQRGPLVFCIEGVDNDVDFDQVSISENAKYEATFDKNLLGGIVTIAYECDDNKLVFIPYYSWDNRESGEMKVWIPLT